MLIMQFLGLKGRESYLEPQILSAYEELASTVVEEGYSSRVQDGKLRILEQAADEVRVQGVTGRSSEIQVQWDDLPGALALLQEVGEYDLVVAMGTKLLETWESRVFRRDILLSMALAQCGLATDTFAVQQVAAGCARMEEALLLLNDGGAPPLAPALQQEIQESLHDLKPQCVLDHLKLPLALEHTTQRKQALQALTDLLTELAGKKTLEPQYLQQALLCLTAREVVHLLDWPEVVKAPKNAPWQDSVVLEQAATAYLVVGFQERQPSLIRASDYILQQISKDRSATVERVVCKVLLGQPESALEALSLAESTPASSQRRPSQVESVLSSSNSHMASPNGALGQALDTMSGPSKAEAAAFVSNHSPDPQDLLPGLCLLTERWLERVAFLAFRQVDHASNASLVDYFQDSRVETYLQSQEEEGTDMLAGIQAWAHNASASLQRIVHQAVPARQQHHTLAEDEGDQEQPQRQMQLLNPLSWSPVLQGLAAASLMLAAALVWSTVRRPSAGIHTQHTLQTPGDPAVSHQVHEQDVPASSATHVHVEQQSPLSTAQAETIVRTWQSAKTAALGPRRDLDALPSILTDPMLSRFQSEAAQAEETGWFWKYKVNSVTVHDVSPVGEDGAVTIKATLQEQADLYGANGKHADSYNNPYTVEYTVVESGDQWKIIDALVLGTQSS
ncbi:hypothetical protein ABBQ38_013833 [Trebouxia sp. C0009 RCD-2024]